MWFHKPVWKIAFANISAVQNHIDLPLACKEEIKTQAKIRLTLKWYYNLCLILKIPQATIIVTIPMLYLYIPRDQVNEKATAVQVR